MNEFPRSHAVRRLKWQVTVWTFGVTALATWVAHGIWPAEIQPGFYSTAAEIEVVLMAALILEQRIFHPAMPAAEEQWAGLGISALGTGLMFAVAGATGLFGALALGPTVAGLVASLIGLLFGVVLQGVNPPPDEPLRPLSTAHGTHWYPSLRSFFQHRPDRVTIRLRPRLHLWESAAGCNAVTYRACWIAATEEVIAVQALDGESPRLIGPVEILGTLDEKGARRLLGRPSPWVPRWESLDSLRARLAVG